MAAVARDQLPMQDLLGLRLKSMFDRLAGARPFCDLKLYQSQIKRLDQHNPLNSLLFMCIILE